MNIKTSNRKRKTLVKLNESQEEMIQDKASKINVKQQKIETSLSVKSKNIEFDCGARMSGINSGVDIKFGLKFHADKSNTVEEFISSIEGFLSVIPAKLTTNDINKLTLIYNNYVG